MGAFAPWPVQVGCKDGALLYFDVRNTSVPVWKVPSLSGDATSALTFRLGFHTPSHTSLSPLCFTFSAAPPPCPACPFCVSLPHPMHSPGTSRVGCSPLANGLLATASEDGSVRLWDVEGAAPALMGSKDMGVVRALFCMCLSPSLSREPDPFLVI